MKQTKKLLKNIAWVIAGIAIIITGVVLYLFNMPHRDVQQTEVFETIRAEKLVEQFTMNNSAANAKYLASDGNSKVLVVEGTVYSISHNSNNETVVLLKNKDARMGVSCTFLANTNVNGISTGKTIKVKGAIIAGNSYDADLDLYNNAMLVQCALAE